MKTRQEYEAILAAATERTFQTSFELRKSGRQISAVKSRDPNSGGTSESSIADRLAHREDVLTVGELAKLLKISDQSIYRMISAGQVPAIAIRGIFRFDAQEIARWLR